MDKKVLCDRLDAAFSKIGNEGDVYVSRFYCTENPDTIVVAMNREVNAKKEIVSMLNKCGYELYDTGANDGMLMFTFRKAADGPQGMALNESVVRKMVRKALREATMHTLGGLNQNAESAFEDIRDAYNGREDELIDRLWYYIEDKPGFINYMNTSGSMGYDDEDYDY